jgi:hypothetical protein
MGLASTAPAVSFVHVVMTSTAVASTATSANPIETLSGRSRPTGAHHLRDGELAE